MRASIVENWERVSAECMVWIVTAATTIPRQRIRAWRARRR
jgi:hypothetical protein